MIDSNRLHEMFVGCFFKADEIEDAAPKDPDMIVTVQGIVSTLWFHKERLAACKDEIVAMLAQLPVEFHKSTGGGWSFLNLCNTKDGAQWGEHQSMEQLVALAIGLELGNYTTERKMWAATPGGMPYVCFDIEAELEGKETPDGCDQGDADGREGVQRAATVCGGQL